MADQGKILITMPIPASTARGLLISGAGTLSATLRAVGVTYEGTSASETIGQCQIGGIALVQGSGAINAGVPCRSDAAGKAVASAADGSDADLVCCIPLETMADGVLSRCKIV